MSSNPATGLQRVAPTLAKRFDELRRHQSRRVAVAGEPAPPVVRRPQASSPNTHGGSCTAQAAKVSRRNTRVNTLFPDGSAAHTTRTSFARSIPTVVISFMTSALVQINGQHFNLGTSDAVRFSRFE